MTAEAAPVEVQETMLTAQPVVEAAPAAVVPPAAPAAPAAEPSAEPKGNWNDNWKETMLKELGLENDAAAQNKINRFASPSAAFKSFLEADKKISSGQLKAPFPKDNPEAQHRWRQENGIPESPDKYDLTLPNGLVLGEADKAFVDDYLKVAHENNVHPDVVKQSVGWFMQKQEEALEQAAKMDSENQKAAEDELRAEFGGNFRQEMATLSNFYQTVFPEDVAAELQFARMPDGTVFGNNPKVVRALLSLAKEMNPAATVVPGSSNSMAAMDTEISDIERKMGTTAYTERDASRYMQLIDARDKLKSRGR